MLPWNLNAVQSDVVKGQLPRLDLFIAMLSFIQTSSYNTKYMR